MIQFVSGVRVVLGVASCARPVPQREQRQTTVSPVGILANSWKLTAITSRPSVKLINAFILAPVNEVLRQRNLNALCIHHVVTANASIPSPPPIPTPLILMKLRTRLYMQERAAAVPEQLETRWLCNDIILLL